MHVFELVSAIITCPQNPEVEARLLQEVDGVGQQELTPELLAEVRKWHPKSRGARATAHTCGHGFCVLLCHTILSVHIARVPVSAGFGVPSAQTPGSRGTEVKSHHGTNTITACVAAKGCEDVLFPHPPSRLA